MRLLASSAGLLVLTVAGLACYDSGTEPPQPLQSDPSFAAVVTQITHDTSYAPAGFQLDQYELFVARLPASAANAGVILGPHSPAFRSRHKALHAVSRATIAVGDTLEVWADTTRAAYGSSQAPEGAPAYIADQVVIRR